MDIITIIIFIIFLITLFITYKIGQKIGASKKDKEWKEELPNHRKTAILRSRAVLGGHFSENLAPYLPDFPFLPTECRFIGKPIDFIVFNGMDEKDISEIIFVEVKSGNAKLSSQEQNLKDAIINKKIKWMEYKVPKELTQKGNIEEKITDIIEDKLDEAKKEIKKTLNKKGSKNKN